VSLRILRQINLRDIRKSESETWLFRETYN